MAAVPSEEELLDLAERAARAAARELLARWGGDAVALRTKSSPTDPVSEADLAAEHAIRRVIGEARPGDPILGEEGGQSGSAGADALSWVVDPLDGTVNYLYGLPVFAVSVACRDAAGALAGVVIDPMREECFAATRSGLARLGGVVLEPERPAELAQTLVATGFGYDPEVRRAQAGMLPGLLGQVRDIRRAGAAAIDLCWCAAGRVDAYYERGVRPWDVAAGELICRRAGGLVVRPMPELAADPRSGGIALPAGLLVAPAAVADQLEALVAGPPPAG